MSTARGHEGEDRDDGDLRRSTTCTVLQCIPGPLLCVALVYWIGARREDEHGDLADAHA